MSIMASSSEDVLLIVPSVWHKKSSGSLYLMGERVAWMSDSKSVFQISHNYIDIKLQKISPDTKEKVQLQLVMHNGEANTFHFRNPGGRNSQVADREKIKEHLQTLLPQFRNKINSELELKHKMLQEDKQLFQLYNDLVVCGVISAEEFWANRLQSSKDTILRQNVGVSPAFLSEIKPQSTGANSISYNLTTDMMEAIFKTYPQVKKKHLECVPHAMTESEFWTKFFQSHYFHRDRTHLENKDVFTECAKSDEKDMSGALEECSKTGSLLVDMTEMSDNTLGEGYSDTTSETRASTNSSNLTIIKRFNHHSTRVLKTADSHTPSLQTSDGKPDTSAAKTVTEQTQDNKRKFEESTLLEDLQPDSKEAVKPNLKLFKVDRYFHGPVPQLEHSKYRSTEDMLRAANSLVHEVEQWKGDIKCSLTSEVARDILTQLSPGGSLMQGHSEISMSDMVPADIRSELRNLYCALNELLRHFWACFPTQTKQLEDKLIKMEQNLQRFSHSKLNPFKEKIQPYSFSFNLTDHMDSQLQTAYERYQKWYTKKMHKSSSSPTLSSMTN